MMDEPTAWEITSRPVVTVMLAALSETLGVMLTVIWVGLFTVIWFTVTSLVPNPTVVRPWTKLVEVLSHQPYSPNLVTCDFFLFSELKKHLCGNRYECDDALNNAVTGALEVISKNGLMEAFEARQNH